jgi:cytochrome c551/c552
MPILHLQAQAKARKAEIFAHLPFNPDNKDNAAAEDGVSCSVCHQIANEKLGTRESFNGAFAVDTPNRDDQRPEYGPFAIDAGHQRVMQSSTGGFLPTPGAHVRQSALCGTCHTLYTQSLGPDGKEIATFPEQMPFLEWLHSDYPSRSSCQSCHMPEVNEKVPVTALFGEPREGTHRHEFVAANFFMQRVLNNYRADLSVAALPQELTMAANRTVAFLQTQSARVSIRNLESTSGGLSMEVLVENLSGHKLPTAYPSRRVWLHIAVRDRNGQAVFESGALNPDGSIKGNRNDSDPLQFEPHYQEITSPEQVQIYEPILKDSAGHVTTGLLSAIGYLKDNRLLPSGFSKQNAEKDIAVIGEAANDPNFTDKGNIVRYSVSTAGAAGPFHVQAELWYQPIGFRWAHNLAPYIAEEPRRFVSYYESMSSNTAVVLASAEATQ